MENISSAQYYVYLIHNIKNNKVYVGMTKDIKRRWLSHISNAKDNNINCQYIHKAMRKYGLENFVFSIIQILNNKNDCDNAEIYWIKFFNSKSKAGYNLTNGGDSIEGYTHTEETKKRISDKHMGKKLSPEQLKRTTEQLRNMSKIKIGIPLSEEHKKKLSEARTGMRFTEEHRKNISLGQKGKRMGKENSFFGRKHTEETKELIRGENSKSAKLKTEGVIKIREMYASGEYTQEEISKLYGVSRRGIGHVISGATWRHIK